MAALSRPLVLVVDDEPIIAQLITDVLTGDGYDVDTASDGLVALECLGRRAYDLILSDLRMPGLDGLGGWSRTDPSWRAASSSSPAPRSIRITRRSSPTCRCRS